MYNTEDIDVIAYYFSEFDMKAFEALGYETRSGGFKGVAPLFGKNENYLKRLRDEFDVVTHSHRRGQCNRPPRQRIIEARNSLCSLSFEELTDAVSTLIQGTQV